MPRAHPAAAVAAVGDCLLRFVHRRSMALILSAYVLALLGPGFGRAAGHTMLIGSGPHAYRVPAAILGWTLVMAGANVDVRRLAAVVRRPVPLLLGVLASVLAPLLVVLAAAAAMAGTPVSAETQCLLAGLAIVAAMPVGGTAAAWTANGGDPALGVGILAGSLAASPVTVPAGLAVGSLMTFGDLADDLDRMTSVSDGLRGMVIALLPCAVGVALRSLWPAAVLGLLPFLRVVTVLDVAGLAYVNASGLPRDVLLGADPEFLAAVVAAAVVMCAGTFAAGWLLARCGRCSTQDTVALTYTTGMTNASLGAIVACTGLREHTMVLVPILAVSVLQTLAAGWVGRLVARGWRRSAAPAHPSQSVQ